MFSVESCCKHVCTVLVTNEVCTMTDIKHFLFLNKTSAYHLDQKYTHHTVTTVVCSSFVQEISVDYRQSIIGTIHRHYDCGQN